MLCFVPVFLAIISLADSQQLELTCTYLQFGLSYSVPSYAVLRTLAIDCTNGYRVDIFRTLRRVRSGILPVPISMTEGSNCTLSGTFRHPIIFEFYSFPDAFCNIPDTEMSLPAEVSANISESASINCNVTSSHYVNITWMKNGYQLVTESNMEINETFLDNSPNSFVSISTITFLAVRSSYTGWYNCSMVGTKSKSSASLSVYLRIQKGSTTRTKRFAALSSTVATTTATTVATTSENTQEDIFDHTLFYTTIGILVALLLTVTFSLAVFLVYCSGMKTIKEEKMNVQDFVIHISSAPEKKDFVLVNMKEAVTIQG